MNLDKLKEIVKRLRAPDGCPWDIEQTFQSLTPHIIEEAYELVDAIESEDVQHFKEELGDVLLHVVMLSEMADEKGWFKLDDVAKDVTDKMIRRHPHVFGDKSAQTADDVWVHWEEAKKKENPDSSVMDNIPKLPALIQASKIQKKAARVGFDWPDKQGPIDKLREEVAELVEAVEDPHHREEELGDVLFSLVNICRHYQLNAEDVLRHTNQKFVKRFKLMESLFEGRELQTLSLREMEAKWQEAKQLLKQ